MAIDRSYIAENDRKRRRLEAPTVQGRARSSDRIPKLLASAALGLATALGPTAAVEAQSSPAVTVTNALPTSTVCPNGNTVSVFAPQQQVIQPGGNSIRVTGDFSNFPGLGIQVNNWYWTSIQLPVQSGNPQDPDNSGAQFSISSQCVLARQPAWYGKGIPTYLIATVTAAKTSDGCAITIAPSAYTNAVTPGCCAPPGIGSNTCTGPWGVTSTGQPWPPR